jgi:hypothetical protein
MGRERRVPQACREGNHYGFYCKHTVAGDGARRTVRHYVPKRKAHWRREKLVWLMKRHGWCGMKYFASLVNVSGHTVGGPGRSSKGREDRAPEPRGYLADLSGTLLEEKP